MYNQTNPRWLICPVLLVLLSISCCFLPDGPVLAADRGIITILAPGDLVPCGQRFTVKIHVVPNHEIVGIQLNIGFDPKLMRVENVAEGDLLTGDGASTFFNPGEIDNAAGTIKGVFAAILSPGETVATEGVIGVLSCVGLQREGYASISLSNVIIGSVEGLPLPVTIINDSVHIGREEATGGSAGGGTISGSSGGGGGGGGGAAVGDKRFTGIAASATSEGTLWEDVTVYSVDIMAQVHISAGTTVLNANGYPPNSITVITQADSGMPPEDCSFIGNTYEFMPDGVTFAPSANLTLRYEDSSLPEGSNESGLRLAVLDNAAGLWQPLEYRLDSENNCISANITHFSRYAILSGRTPCSFVFSPLTLSEINPATGERLMVSTTVTNTGDLAGMIPVVFSMDKTEVARRDITLDGGRSMPVNFLFSAGAAGIHVASIGTETCTFTVRERDPAGAVAGIKTATITSSLTTSPGRTAASSLRPGDAQTAATETVASGTPLPMLNGKDYDWVVPGIGIAGGGILLIMVVTYSILNRRRH